MSFSSEQQNTDIHTRLPELNIQDLEQMNDEEFWKHARQRTHGASEQPSHLDYLECKLSGGLCLVPLRNLVGVLLPPYRLARLPGMPTWMAGIMAWRGKTIAVANLDLYFLPLQSAGLTEARDEALLVVYAQDQALGLLTPAPGLVTSVEMVGITPLADSTNVLLTKEAGIFGGMYADVPVLNISALLTSLVQQIGMATAHG